MDSRTRLLVHLLIGISLLIGLTSAIGPLAAAEPEPVIHLDTAFNDLELDAPAPLTTPFQDQLESLQRQIDELRAAPPVKLVSPPPAPAPPSYPTVRVTGFFQADAAWFAQDPANRIAVGDIPDGADFRRARLAATGKAWDNISYMLEMDFGFPGRPSFMDVWLEIEDACDSGNLRIGLFRAPLGMDVLTSVKELTFLERSLPSAFLPFRQIGAMLHGHDPDELMTWAISGFRYPTDVFGGNVGDDGGYGLATRLTGLLINRGGGNGLLHLGGGYSFIDPTNNQFQYFTTPEILVQETGGGVPAGALGNVPPFVDTGVINADYANLFSAELAVAKGAFYAQSEVFYANVSQRGGPTLVFPGTYVQAGYFLTGETRVYNGKGGVFGRVKPRCNVGKQGGIGAWEVAGRWSYLDLNDNNIQGGRLNDLTAGLNWYLNPFTKFQFNYIHAFLDSPVNGDSDTDIFATRAQVDF